MAKAIRIDFPAEPLLLLGVLKGAVLFLADLSRQIPGEVTFDFIAVSSYGKDSRTSGQVKLNKDIDSSIEGKTVIVVEDILDTGLTLRYLLRILQQRKPKNLRVAVLLDKVDRRLTDVQADYVGFPFAGGLQNFFRGNHHAEINHFVIIASKHDADDVLADVMDVAFDRGHEDAALRLMVSRSLFLLFHKGKQIGDCLFHDAGALDDLRQKHSPRSE